ncbi:hypothetical protein [Methanosarcina horonobensis]|uniref:hypothetical protein n=1 Tax=Methanosarcina horonobensis TaxID=418008 RepID=UPI000AF84FDE
MGWCPNAKTAGAGSRISLDNFEAPTQSGGGKTGSKGTISQFIRQFTRLRNRPYGKHLSHTPLSCPAFPMGNKPGSFS